MSDEPGLEFLVAVGTKKGKVYVFPVRLAYNTTGDSQVRYTPEILRVVSSYWIAGSITPG